MSRVSKASCGRRDECERRWRLRCRMCSGCRYVASRATSCDGEGREKQALDGTLVVGVLIEWRGVQCSVSRSGALKHTRIGTLEHRNIGNRQPPIAHRLSLLPVDTPVSRSLSFVLFCLLRSVFRVLSSLFAATP